MFVKKPNEDLFHAILDHPGIQIFEIFDCDLDNSSSLEIIDCFSHEGWGAIYSVHLKRP